MDRKYHENEGGAVDDTAFKKSEYRCSCGGTRHKCDMVRIAELEAENKTTNGIISGLANVVKEAGEDLQKAEAELAQAKDAAEYQLIMRERAEFRVAVECSALRASAEE